MEKNEYCWCGSGLHYDDCHHKMDIRLEEYRKQGFLIPPHKIIKNKEQIQGIKDSAKINIAVLDEVAKRIEIGMSTAEIDQIVTDTTASLGGICAPYLYEGFPKSVCTSINDEVCHGIPSEKRFLKEGDIVNVDVSTIYHGYYSDSSRMFCIGHVDPQKEKLVQVTKEAIQVGLNAVIPYTPIGNVGHAIHEFAKLHGYSVVKEVGGHGIGLEFHEDPFVSFVSKQNTGMLMVPGLCFTIEPMINLGTPHVYLDRDNGWTIYTMDKKASAQWEVQVLVTEEGYEIIAY